MIKQRNYVSAFECFYEWYQIKQFFTLEEVKVRFLIGREIHNILQLFIFRKLCKIIKAKIKKETSLKIFWFRDESWERKKCQKQCVAAQLRVPRMN